MSPSVVWVGGRLVTAADPAVAADDHGLVVGDGVFETLRTVGGRPFALRRHLMRLRRSARGLDLDVPGSDADLGAAVEAVLAAGGWPEARIRVTVTGGPGSWGSIRGSGPPTVIVAAAPLEPLPATAAVVVVPWPRNERGALAGLKTTSYAENVVALAHARRRGADEAIFANTAGELCEGTGSNVFVVRDGVALTPPLRSGCLAGVTRELLLEQGVASEADLPLSALHDAEEAFLTSTTRDVQPVATVDGRALPRVDGPVTAAARAALGALMAATADP